MPVTWLTNTSKVGEKLGLQWRLVVPSERAADG